MLRLLVALFVLPLMAAPAMAGAIKVTVDLSSQTMIVTVDGVREYNWAVSTGKRGHRTPTGTYHPQRMYEEYYSRKYDNAPMPYSIFFSGGFAIHGTEYVSSLGSPRSHGCVRLDPHNARILYRLVQRHGTANTTIRIKA